MKTIKYSVSEMINNSEPSTIYTDGVATGTVQRIYSNKIKKLVDSYFDYRYFLQYEAEDLGEKFRVKKIFRRGKLWYEGRYEGVRAKTIITYDNWRIGIPELYIIQDQIKIKIEKEHEEASLFYEGDTMIARWQAIFNEEQQCFDIELQIEESATIQEVAFYVAISQATLFIGA